MSHEGCNKHCWAKTCAGLATIPFSVFAGVMIWMGSENVAEDKCPSAPGLPVLLIVGGILIVLWISLRQSLEWCCGSFCEGLFNKCQAGGKLAKCGMKVLYDSFYITAITIWWIVALVYAANNIPNTAEEGDFLCATNVYNMTMVSLVVVGLIIAFGVIFLIIGRICCNVFCCKICKDSSEGHVVNA